MSGVITFIFVEVVYDRHFFCKYITVAVVNGAAVKMRQRAEMVQALEMQSSVEQQSYFSLKRKAVWWITFLFVHISFYQWGFMFIC